MALIITISKQYRQLILYLVIGAIAASSDITVFTVLIKLAGFEILLANLIGNIIGITLSFLLNRQFNFKIKDNLLKRFFIFFAVGTIGIVTSTILLYVLVKILSFDEIFSKFIILLTVVALQYTLNSKVSFKQ